jgi:uncharacterized membrane protein
MAELIAIGYPDETTAAEAAREVERLAQDLVIQPDAIAVITRDSSGAFHVTTNHDVVASGTVWGMFWGLLFGTLFFVPVLGMGVGAGLGALFGLLGRRAVSERFQSEVRDMLQPGTSALFLIVEKITIDKTLEALSKYDGTVLKTSLPNDVEQEIQEALHGSVVTSEI